ncbi:hypothetical protein BKP37_07250 [Anaerobacillus alkalilacustris]|uniref:Chromosome-anchoring protein RacA n=1 Tax=Anaerobacillus alkalilacustris TaxID=393763 RepID=A0A1S2LQH8_9BACI|nr:chromosome-anchoring protein RacA [Anaerobacillus alkalilacustris]OIJ14769.1 hypothetical protein BKP37_07250 [Anaerobacillus alkalilacustris]
MDKLLKKTKVVSEELGVNPTTVQRWIKYFNIPCVTNDQGHYLIAPEEFEILRSIKDKLNQGLTMKDILESDNTMQEGFIKNGKKEEMLSANVIEERLEQLMIHIEQLERKLSVKADEVVEYQVLQHRSELDNLFTMIKRIEDRMSKMEQRLTPVLDQQKVVGGIEHELPEKLNKPKKSKLMRIFSF